MRKRYMTVNRTLAILLLMSFVFAIGGCSVKSKRKLISYANENYGSAKLIGYDSHGSGNDAVNTVTLKDKETGIEYTVTSRMMAINIDGSIFGYSEQTSSDFEKKYLDYIFDEASSEIRDLENEFDLRCEYPKLIFNTRVSNATAYEAVKQYSDLIRKYDTKKLFEPELLVYAEGNVFIGSYEAKTDDWNATKEYDVIDYVHEKYDKDAVYVDTLGAYISQFLSWEEIDERFPDSDGTPSGNAYYFRDKDGDLFVAIDLKDFGAKESEIRLFRDLSSGMEEIEF